MKIVETVRRKGYMRVCKWQERHGTSPLRSRKGCKSVKVAGEAQSSMSIERLVEGG